MGTAGGSVSGVKPFVSQKMKMPQISSDMTVITIPVRFFGFALYAPGEPEQVDDFEDGYIFLQLRHFQNPIDLSRKSDLSLQFGHVLSDSR
jgi:hypothetical protein